MTNLQVYYSPDFAPHPFLLDTIPGIDPGPLPSHVPGLPGPDGDPEIEPGYEPDPGLDPDPDPDPALPPGPGSPGIDPGFEDPFPGSSPVFT